MGWWRRGSSGGWVCVASDAEAQQPRNEPCHVILIPRGSEPDSWGYGSRDCIAGRLLKFRHFLNGDPNTPDVWRSGAVLRRRWGPRQRSRGEPREGAGRMGEDK